MAGVLSDQAGVSGDELADKITTVSRELRTPAVQLDTALMFSEFRDYATSGERRRLAREMHDGVAQDIASLGYLVDALAARPSSPEQQATLAMLRDRITHVVAEVRQSVLSLRTSIGESESLGAAIASIARGLSETSGIAIQVTVDEHTGRLRPEVEAELFRITQEAMNNAIKHSQATAIEVHCQVYAPAARITVTDNGRGMQQARTDSHGLKIMRERARLINAELTITSNPTGGLSVSVHRRVRHRRRCFRRTPGSVKVGPWVTTPIRILIVDDHELIRSGLGAVIDLEPDLSVVGTAGNVSEALARYDELKPAVVIADLQLPDGTGLDIVRSDPRPERHHRAGGADHALGRRADLRGHAGRRVRLRREGRPGDRGGQGRAARCDLAARVHLRRPGAGDDPSRVR